MSDWNSSQYMKFGNQRTQPSIDLINRLGEMDPQSILDIGCGPGNSTAALHRRFPRAALLGIDSSDAMLQKASETYPDLSFSNCVVPGELDRLETSFDLIFSNACLHWIPRQEQLLSAVMGKLKAGGTLAVQIPLTQEAPFYKMLGQLTAGPKWRQKLGGIRNFHSLTPEEYYDVLSRLSEEAELWQTTYYHTVRSPSGILEWYKGSGLRPYLDVLDPEEKTSFQQDILCRIQQLYPVQADGTILLKMPRLFFLARK